MRRRTERRLGCHSHLRCCILTTIAAAAFATSSTVSAPPKTVDELRQEITTGADAIDIGATMTQLAEALLSKLSRDRTDIAVLFGAPTSEQLDRAFGAATDALDLTERAEEPLLRAVDRLADDPGFADRRDLQDLRSSYQVDYLLTRLPLARARSAVLLASVATSPAESARLADQALETLNIIETGGAMIEALRFSITTAAKLARGDAVDATFIGRLIEFTDSDALAEVSRRSPQISLELPAAAAVLLSQARRYEQAHQFVTRHFNTDQPNALAGIVRRDCHAKIDLARARRATSHNDRDRALIDAIDAIADENAVHSAGLLELALSKIERIIPTEKMNMKLPIAGRIARGRLLLEQDDAADAVAPLQSAWEELDSSNPTLKQACGWLLAKALRQRAGGVKDMERAGRTLLTLSNIAQSSSTAAGALQSGVALLQWSLDNADRSDDPSLLKTIKESLRIGLRSALAQWPDSPSADDWRLRLAGLSGPAQRRLLLKAVTPSSDLFVRARLALAWMEFEELGETPDASQREAVALTMFQYARQAQQAAQSEPKEELGSAVHQALAVASVELGRFDRAAAEALKWDDAGGAGSPDAVDYVRKTLSRALDDAEFVEDAQQADAVAEALAIVSARALRREADGRADRSIVDWAVLDLARSLVRSAPDEDHIGAIQTWADQFGVSRGVGDALALVYAAHGDDERAAALYRQVVEASRTLDVNDEFFWRAWAGMLDILSEHNAAGDRSEAILRQIAQLRAADSHLGGRLTRRQIELIDRAARAPKQP